MTTIRFIAAAAFALAASVPASAEELSLDFDQGLDVSAIVDSFSFLIKNCHKTIKETNPKMITENGKTIFCSVISLLFS